MGGVGTSRIEQTAWEGEIVGRMTRLGATFDVPRYSAVTPMTDFVGNLEYVALYAGESCDLVNDVKPAAAIVRDACERLRRY
jgi:nitronate monooxygenase